MTPASVVALQDQVKLGARPLTPSELGELARKMIDAETPKGGDRLEKELVDGFWGMPKIRRKDVPRSVIEHRAEGRLEAES
jgi:hypothetical protein